MKSLDDILASQKFHPSVERALLASQTASDLRPDQNPKCQEVAENERRLAQGVLKIMDDAKLDVLVHGLELRPHAGAQNKEFGYPAWRAVGPTFTDRSQTSTTSRSGRDRAGERGC
jgi:hypothetical protein